MDMPKRPVIKVRLSYENQPEFGLWIQVQLRILRLHLICLSILLLCKM